MKTIPIELLTFRDIYTTYQEGKERQPPPTPKKKKKLKKIRKAWEMYISYGVLGDSEAPLLEDEF